MAETGLDPTRARLVAAALRLMQCHGYGGIGLAAILEAAKAPKGSLYHHFPTGKEGLAIAAVEHVGAEVDAALARMMDDGLGLAAILRTLADQCGQWLEQTGFEQTPLLAAMSGGGAPPAVCAAAARVRAGWIARLSTSDGGSDRARLALAVLDGGLLAARLSRDLADLSGPVAEAADALARAEVPRATFDQYESD